MELIAREAKRVSLALFDNPDVLDDVDAILAIEILSFVNRRGFHLSAAERIAIKAIVLLAEHSGLEARNLMVELVA